jgi:hypothetical protein
VRGILSGIIFKKEDLMDSTNLEPIGTLKDRIRNKAVILSIWENPAVKDGKNIELLNFVFTRGYFNKKLDKFSYTSSFRESDLLDIKNAIDAYFSKNNNKEAS